MPETPIQSFREAWPSYIRLFREAADIGAAGRTDALGETAQEHIRNAQAILHAVSYDMGGPCVLERSEYEAVMARLTKAVRLLEGGA